MCVLARASRTQWCSKPRRGLVWLSSKHAKPYRLLIPVRSICAGGTMWLITSEYRATVNWFRRAPLRVLSFRAQFCAKQSKRKLTSVGAQGRACHVCWAGREKHGGLKRSRVWKWQTRAKSSQNSTIRNSTICFFFWMRLNRDKSWIENKISWFSRRLIQICTDRHVTREGISDSDLKMAEGEFQKLALWDLIKLQVEAPQAEG